ncbi:MAG: ATPase, partial [Clostridia bacterium]|nr:ATPase [Clostridia bacterium]
LLNGEEHVKDIAHLTTLAGYVHFCLTGQNVIGVGEASGMFPINSETLDYDEEMMRSFSALTGIDLRALLPAVLPAGEKAGTLSEDGAKILDPSGTLKAGIPFAPCEGDAGTGMVATNSVRVRTGNVSAGTSDFAMIVTDKPLGVHREIDMVTTPDGLPVAMAHCNNCTSDINAWINLFYEFCSLMGIKAEKRELFSKLFNIALDGGADCGGLLSYNYFSGEGITDLDEGRPVFARMQNADFSLANFMRTHLLSALATLKIGLDILTQRENVEIDRLYAHGGYFKVPEVGQRMLSAAVGAPVSVMETAGEGGPFGMALLAAYMLKKDEGEKLPDYLDGKVFANAKSFTLMADKKDVEGFNAFLERYKKALPAERCLTEVL